MQAHLHKGKVGHKSRKNQIFFDFIVVIFYKSVYTLIMEREDHLGCSIILDILNLHLIIGIPKFLHGCQAALQRKAKVLMRLPT